MSYFAVGRTMEVELDKTGTSTIAVPEGGGSGSIAEPTQELIDYINELSHADVGGQYGAPPPVVRPVGIPDKNGAVIVGETTVGHDVVYNTGQFQNVAGCPAAPYVVSVDGVVTPAYLAYKQCVKSKESASLSTAITNLAAIITPRPKATTINEVIAQQQQVANLRNSADQLAQERLGQSSSYVTGDGVVANTVGGSGISLKTVAMVGAAGLGVFLLYKAFKR